MDPMTVVFPIQPNPIGCIRMGMPLGTTLNLETDMIYMDQTTHCFG